MSGSGRGSGGAAWRSVCLEGSRWPGRALTAPARVPPLFEQAPDIRHRPEQFHRLIRQRQETLPFVEASGGIVLRINDHRKGRNLASGRATKRVG